MTRADRAAARRLAWHQGRVDDAETPRKALWAACNWLVSEAWRAGPDAIDGATDMILTRVHEIRGDQNDSSRYAA